MATAEVAQAAPAIASHEDAVSERSPYYERRIKQFESIFSEQEKTLEQLKQNDAKIQVTYNGEQLEAIKGVTSPRELTGRKDALVARVKINGSEDFVYWDIFRPLTDSCELSMHSFEDKYGKHAFWHSSAHILGASLELRFGVDLTIGPALEHNPTGPGFYYDCYIGDRTLGQADKDFIKKQMTDIVKGSHPFQRIELSREAALDMFKENKFKQELINSFPAHEAISVYRCGPMVDLCEGPHVPNTAAIKSFDVLQMSRAYWRGDQARESLYRVYGVSFPNSKQLKEWHTCVEEAKKRDHRHLGIQQELFHFSERSPGSPFFTFYGMRIYLALQAMIKGMYKKYGYQEVFTPNIFHSDLWRTSGHWDNYQDCMFVLDVEKQQWGLKPMNCPGHCELFGSRVRSYHELPMRMAEFGVLHRNEFSGALQGLTRVRRFIQDDAHIFCRASQVTSEVISVLDMLQEVYHIFGLEFSLALSTRPEKYLGEIELWNDAEAGLTEALNRYTEQTGKEWIVDPGEGAFYGPKIDITVSDALGRKFQCATVQLDFQLPIRFKLDYQGEDERERPVIIHRAVLGSIERMLAILAEHYGGKWPLWMSPRQVMIIPISEASQPYAWTVHKALKEKDFFVEVDVKDNKMQKKVREAQLAQFNYILVVGQQEQENQTVNVRTRANEVLGMKTLQEFIVTIEEERNMYSQFPLLKSSAKAAPSTKSVDNGATEGSAESTAESPAPKASQGQVDAALAQMKEVMTQLEKLGLSADVKVLNDKGEKVQ